MKEDILIMSQRELQRLQIIQKVLGKEINQRQASEVLRITDRQVRRIVKRVRREGERGIAHRLHGRKGNRRIDPKTRNQIIGIYRKTYEGFGPRLASEKLLEREKIRINEETLRLWLIEEGLWKKRKGQKEKKRSWRPRKDHYGEMVQMDGSHHDWLEGRGPKLVLMGYIDDATGRVYGKFYDYEGTQPAFDSLKGYVKKNGIPRSIYLDKHSTYKVNKKQQRYKAWPFRDEEGLTQFARGCQQLGIELIYANSPQAKGRIERLFETFQDRLVKELRLEGAKTLKEANQALRYYLPKFNKKFSGIASQPGNLHRPVLEVDLDEILSAQKEHVLRNDRTFIHERQRYQVLDRTRASRIVVHEYLNGRMAVKYGKNRLAYKPIDERPVERKAVRKVKPRRPHIPPRGSYWRDGFKLAGSLR